MKVDKRALAWLASSAVLGASSACGASSSSAPPSTPPAQPVAKPASQPQPPAETASEDSEPLVEEVPSPAAAADPPDANFSTKTFNVGDTAKAIDFALVLHSVKECHPKYYFSKPKKGSIWLGVELTVESTSDTQIWSNPNHAELVDRDKVTYNYAFASTQDCDPGLRARQLNKSEKSKGWVVFEVPEKASGIKLTYNPSLFGAPQQVTFDLGR